jgi:hypothetical protein
MAAFLATGGCPIVVEGAGATARERGRRRGEEYQRAEISSLRQPGSWRETEAEPRKFEPDGRSAKIR